MTFPTIPTSGAGRVLFQNQANTTATRTFPSLTGLTKNAGDLLIAICVGYQSTSATSRFGTWGGGFTEFHDSGSSTTMAIGCAYKWSTGSETGTFTVVQAATITGHASMILLSIPGAHDTSPPEANGRASGTSTAGDPAAFNPSWAAEDILWIAVAGAGETGTGGSFDGVADPPANYTNLFITGATADAVGATEAAVAFRQLNADSEDVGPFNVDTSNARNAAVLIAVRPAAGAPPPNAGAATGTVVAAGDSTGSRPSTGAATGTVVATGSAAGARVSAGSATGTVVAAGSATGTQPVVEIPSGSAAGTVVAAGTATGTTSPSGQGTGAVSAAGSATGSATTRGSATGQIMATGTAAGTRASVGAATSNVTTAGSATGTSPTVGVNGGSATSTLAITGTAAGRRASTGEGTGTVALAGGGAGQRTSAGAATGAVAVTGSATGGGPVELSDQPSGQPGFVPAGSSTVTVPRGAHKVTVPAGSHTVEVP